MIKLPTSLISILLILTFMSACRHSDRLQSQEGYVAVPGGRIWYRVISQEATASQPPLLLLHGGPGFPSYYLSPLYALARQQPVIVFDQLDCGRSDRPGDTTQMSISAHIGQIDALLQHLKVKQFYLYGHSYGTMLAVDYYLKHPGQIKALILGSPCMSTQRWVTDADTLMQTLPDSVRLVLQRVKKGIQSDSLKTARALDVYFSTFYNRRAHVPRVDSSIAQMGTALYTHMWGQSEFVADGTLKNYNRIPDLHKISVPTLLLAGEYDAARPATVRYYASLIPNARFVLVKNAGHETMNDVPGVDVREISKFLSERK